MRQKTLILFDILSALWSVLSHLLAELQLLCTINLPDSAPLKKKILLVRLHQAETDITDSI